VFTRLHVHNFKAIGPGPFEIELRPLTILVGPNGSGKSSLLEALALTAQSATEDPQHHDIVLSGSKVDFSVPESVEYRERYRSVYYALDMEKPLTVGVEIDAGSLLPEDIRLFLLSAFKVNPSTRVSYRWTRQGKTWVTWHHYLESGKLVFFHFWRKLERSDAHTASTTELGEATGVEARQMGPHLDRLLSRELFLNDVASLYSSLPKDYRDQVLALVRDIHEKILYDFVHVHCLSTLRGSQPMHTEVGPEVSFVGKHGEYTIRLLAAIQSKTTPIFTKLKKWARKFNLAEIEPGWAGGKTLKVAFSDPLTGVPLDQIFSASSGSVQGLMMASQLLLTEQGSTILIEEPENNLHPAFEKLLPGLFSDSIASGHQVIVSTHSEVLIAAIGNAVRKKMLDAGQVAVYHLERDKEGVKAEKIDISDRGYLDGWVKSFAAVEKELFDEWYKGLPEEGEKSNSGHAHTGGRRKGGKRRKTK
jgi:predicted ATPase